jgi:ribonucleoside-diphosphate reductase alpha chain
MYYLRTKAAVDAIKFTLNNDKKAEPIAEPESSC